MESDPGFCGELEAGEDNRPSPPPLILRRRARRPLPPVVNLISLLATFVTTLIAGTLLTLDDFSGRTMMDVALTPSLWSLGLSYSLSLILILGAHEMGHYIACRRYGLDATLPFFLPAPSPIGTFGAVIRIRSPFRSRRELFDVGVAGPIAGFAVMLPVLAYGLMHSSIAPPRVPPPQIDWSSSLLLELASRHLLPGAHPGDRIIFHPTLIAAWVGLLATFLNLLPIGQLDGGHMLYALSRRAHRPVSVVAIVGLIVCGMFFGGVHLIVFGALWAAVGPRHPALPEETESLGAGRLLVALAALVIFILCFIPSSPRLS